MPAAPSLRSPGTPAFIAGRRLLVAFVVALLVALTGVVAAPVASAAAPAVTGFSPTSGALGTVVTISGSGFVAPVTVTFGGVAATGVTRLSATSVRATVPAAAATGPVTVTSSGASGASSATFTVLPGAAVAPASGPPTTPTTVTVSGFGAREAVDVYVDTTAVRLGVSTAAGVLTVPVTVPATATPGNHWLTAVGRRSGSAAQVSFLVRTNWTQAGFDNGKTGVNPYENVLSPTTVGKLRQLWRVPVGGSVNCTPAVVAGVVYVSAGDGSISALNASTGARLWTRATGGGTMFSSPVVVGSTLYVGSSDDKLYALNTATGAVRWSAAVGNIVYSSPTVAGNTVFVGSYDNRVYAFDAATGAVRWSYLTGGAVYGTPSVAGGIVYVGSFDNAVYALDAATGALVWSQSLGALVLAPVVVADGYVYAVSEANGGSATLVALQPATGLTRWSTTFTGNSDALGYVEGGLLVVPDSSGVVRAFDAATGTARWSTAVSGVPLRSPVTSGNGVVYVGYDSTFALRASDGALLRSLTAGGRYGGATVVDGTVTVGDSNGSALVRYALPTPPAASARPVPATLRP